MFLAFSPKLALLTISGLLLVACSNNDASQTTTSSPNTQPSTHTSTPAPSHSFVKPSLSKDAAARLTFASTGINQETGIALEGVEYYFFGWCSDNGGFTAEVHDENGFIMSHSMDCNPQQTVMATAFIGEGQPVWIRLTDNETYPSEGFVEVAPMPEPSTGLLSELSMKP